MTDTDGSGTKYSKIANSLIQRIQSGEFPPGSKLPSLRRICSLEECNLSTAVEAFGILQERGFILGRERSGFFVIPRLESLTEYKLEKPVRVPNPGVPDEVSSLLSELADPGFVSFGAAVPDDQYLPFAALQKAYKESLKDPMLYKYADTAGVFELRKKIAVRSSGRERRVSPEEVFITLGCSEAAYTALSLATKPGDKVAVESPLHFILYQILSKLKVQAIEIPTNPYTGLDLGSYESVIKKESPKILVTIPTFSNPSGSLMPLDAKKELLKISARHGVEILEDDIYGELQHSPGPRPSSLLSLDKDRIVTQVSSLSKSVSPGLRIGWMISGKARIEKARSQRLAESIALPTLPQMAAAFFIGSLSHERHLRDFRRKLSGSVLSFADSFLEYFPKGTNVPIPKGGFLLWIELPKGKDSRILRFQAAKKKISLVPGNLFSLSGKYINHFRINAGIERGPRAQSAIQTLGKIAREI
ncbi:PLP-dependent aminotransferase family protein [Leptospira wolffii]|uniref:aminotransferase-like domain-containing protein n=1 Tax=Leptospira wolffii TaxID=409998 RepID=UPI0010823DFF|nr:PLP-dependent aminotransferase family protein [Leptospira wolffii]TGK61576.1 PLP-dependent aminotransferase family protein [Leptospira wolffii]TGK70120.1 PLP-dependent aminotransferase family protein [Leptospira wolffii]TGK77043.1 PLP-dependent aminotransferase family protein [Leptospira wolffii]TGL31105.1 PLP-dependent aminotransferase family protein [Leptospira wolffii]